MPSPDTFWPQALPWAKLAHEQTGVLTSVILAQWADETEYGGTDWSPNNNPGNVGSFDGQPVATFPTLAAGVAAYVQLMNSPDRPAFGATISKASTYQEQCYLLGAAIPVWASSHYALVGGAPGSALVWIIQTYNLTQYDVLPLPGDEKMLVAFVPGSNKAYFCVTPSGAVYAYGGADYKGGVNNAGPNGTSALPAGDTCTDLTVCATDGYMISTAQNNLYAFGTAEYSGKP